MAQTSTRPRKRPKAPREGPGCPIVPQRITHLGKYLDVCNSLPEQDGPFWFRGHADLKWRLTPSALRYGTQAKRDRALDLLADFQRFAEIKLTNPPPPDEKLKWVQLARHHGLPTRLLDWTQNAAIALYFACLDPKEQDGAVFVLNPIGLNREMALKKPRVFDAHRDRELILEYLNLTGHRGLRIRKTIAIHPTWNSERIMLQQGVFTLHGSPYFTLTSKQASSLVCVRIRKEYKAVLLHELERVGVSEMTIFPEPEHLCSYLRRNAELGD